MRHVARQSKILPRRLPQRTAFTLVELLVVMGVLAMMSSLVLVGLASAAEQARVSRTRSQVQKIHELLMTRWEDYRYRRVSPATSGTPRQRQRDRVNKLRELMRMEMPNHIIDLDEGPVTLTSGTEPALWHRYRRVVRQRTGAATWAAAKAAWDNRHQESECLYMILESIQDGETNGLDFFKESEIGDLDGDGLPEILDAWGTPIIWIRWAPLYVGSASNLHDMTAKDPFDPLNVQNDRDNNNIPDAYGNGTFLVNYALYPVILSAGPDETYAIDLRHDATHALHQLKGTNTDPHNLGIPNNPFYDSSPPGVGNYFTGVSNPGDDNDMTGQLGYLDSASDTNFDNISNHVLIISGNN